MAKAPKKGAIALVDVPAKKAATKPKQASTRVTVLGHTPAALLRWMGQQGFDFQQARAALKKFGAENISDITVKCQLYSGRNLKKGLYGAPAAVTKDQAAKIKAAEGTSEKAAASK